MIEQSQKTATPRIKLWIDLDNTPHVPFFTPIIRELEHRGYKVIITARDAFQVYELADAKGLSYTKIGRHYGKHLSLKIFGLVWRSIQLSGFLLHQRPSIALSHGSRSLNIVCNLFGLPTVALSDYEHSRPTPLSSPRWLIAAYPLIAEGLSHKGGRIRYYSGIKEDVYVSEFKPDPSFPESLGLRQEDMIITVRPPADEAHYHNPESEILLAELMKRIIQIKEIRVILLPRNRKQEHAFRTAHPEWFVNSRTIVPPHALDGLDVLWASDLVVSGGGTMNREAAALGVPVYSIFRGKTGAVDRMLEREGRLTMIHNIEEVWTKIKFDRREKNKLPDSQPRTALQDIINHIEEILIIELERFQKSKTIK